MKETKSNWSCVTENLMNNVPEIDLGRYAAFWFHQTPRRVLHCMSYYKFASKLIGKGKRVLDVGCNEGLGTFLIGKECGFAKGVDFDEEAIVQAQKNFTEPFVEFEVGDFLQSEESATWDAVVNFDVIENIIHENSHDFLKGIVQ